MKNSQLPLPSDDSIKRIALSIEKQIAKKDRTTKYAPVKDVLTLLGRGAIIASVFLAPGAAKGFADLIKDTPDYDAWKRFNPSYLRRTLKLLQKQKQIEIVYKNSKKIISLTQRGKRKILQYSLDTLSIDAPKHWDGLWRIVMYDIPKEKQKMRDPFRNMLIHLGFYPMQESVYLYPYSCFDEIEYLRQYYFLDITVQYVLVKSIENDSAYKTFFSLD